MDNRALGDALRHEEGDAVALHRGHDGADIDALVERVAEPQALHAGAQFGDRALVDAFLNQQTRARAAHLPLVEPDRIDDALDGAVEVGVVEDDERAFAAEFERERLATARRLLADEAPDIGRAGEGDLVDAVVSDDRRARLAVAGDEVEDAVGQADALAEFGEADAR